MSGVQPDRLVVRSQEPLARRVDDDTVMFHPARGEYFALDHVGTRVWDLLETPTTVDELCARLREEFDVEPGRCAEDVGHLIGRLLDAGLAEECREPAGGG